ncbi:MAG TPA: ATP-binding protein [Spirochaetia bacterium]|nr:ATP-binding protein [Spirochaetia bacterium]
MNKPGFLVGKGAIVDADYRSQAIPAYRGNPLIEALPAIWTEDEVTDLLTYYPVYDEQDRLTPAHLRLHLLQSTLQFFEPLPIHLELEQRFSRMIRTGYLARNPLDPRFVSSLHCRADLLIDSDLVPPSPRSTATGFTILGISGIGKTTAVERILSLYPQVIYHHAYHDQPLTMAQVVWLKLDCPFDGSIKGLCLNFFQAVDDLLSSRYYERYASGRRTVDELLPRMARVAALHGLGVLVIDEIQHLSEAKSGGSRKMLNFFVQLVNMIGLPVVLVGTYKAQSFLSGEFRQTRRGTGQGDFVWDPMDNDDIWQYFVEALWRFQYTRRPTALTDSLREALYEASAGITDFAVKLYMLAQARAIARDDVTITPGLIRSVAKDSLRLATPILQALRTKDMRLLQGVEDVVPLDVERIMAESENSVRTMGRLETIRRSSQQSPAASLPSDTVTWLIDAGIPAAIAQQAAQEAVENSADGPAVRQKALEVALSLLPGQEAAPPAKPRSRRKVESGPKVILLQKITDEGHQSGKTPHEALKGAGLIVDLSKFLTEVGAQ